MRIRMLHVCLVLVCLAALGAAAFAWSGGWLHVSDRPVRSAAIGLDGAPLLITEAGVNERDQAVRAVTEALERGVEDPTGILTHTLPEFGVSALGERGRNYPVETSTAIIKVQGHDIPLSVVISAGGQKLTERPGTGTPRLVESHSSNEYLALYEEDIVVVDGSDLTARSVTPSILAGFSKDALREKASEIQRSFVWVDHPVWSGDDSKIVYTSNRKSVAEGSKDTSEVWYVDISTGEHQVLCVRTGFVSLLGGIGDKILYSDGKAIGYICLSTSESSVLVADGRFMGLGSGRLASALDYTASDSLQVIEPESGNQRVLSAPSGFTFERLVFSPSGSRYVALIRTSAGLNALAEYAEAGATAKLVAVHPLPAGFQLVTSLCFLDENQVLVNLYSASQGQIREHAYILAVEGADQ